MRNEVPIHPGKVLALVGGALIVLFAIIAMSVGGCGLYKGWQRGQKRADAHNAVSLTKIQIQNQNQYARVILAHNAVVSAQAHQRYLQAVGIRAAQDEIRKTLTPLYIQHEAIQAEEQIASSGQNNTVVYVPSGAQGIPMVNNVGTAGTIGKH